MERTETKFKPLERSANGSNEVIRIDEIDAIEIGTPLLGRTSAELNRELATVYPFNTEVRRIIDTGSFASSVQRLGKRFLDLFGASVALLLFSPIYFLVAFLISLDSRGPIIFSQTRVGKNGRLFKFYKFRSMIVNAEALKSDLMHFNEVDGPAFKMKDDPRITKIGRFLRKSSLDELPQLWNVLKGDMSLVGPRPALPDEVAQWESWQYQRLAVEQGCTCIWQVSGRSDTNFQQWMRMDLEYVKTWSIGLDIMLILRTVLVMLTGRGAY